MTPYAAAVAILPGSRPHECPPPRADADGRLRARPIRSRRAWMLAFWSRQAWTKLRGVGSETCALRRVATFDVDPTVGAMGVLRAFDAAPMRFRDGIPEAALAEAIPVAYRVGNDDGVCREGACSARSTWPCRTSCSDRRAFVGVAPTGSARRLHRRGAWRTHSTAATSSPRRVRRGRSWVLGAARRRSR